jgi:hypothetical protein
LKWSEYKLQSGWKPWTDLHWLNKDIKSRFTSWLHIDEQEMIHWTSALGCKCIFSLLLGLEVMLEQICALLQPKTNHDGCRNIGDDALKDPKWAARHDREMQRLDTSALFHIVCINFTETKTSSHYVAYTWHIASYQLMVDNMRAC